MDLPEAVSTALERHDSFAATPDGHRLETTELETVVGGEALPSGGYLFRVTVAAPTLAASVADQTVGTTLADSWFETLERRLADAFHVAQADAHEPPAVTRADGGVEVLFVFEAADPARGVADAKALAEFVEGTYVEGLIPGFEYRGPADRLLRRAREQGRDGADRSDGRP